MTIKAILSRVIPFFIWKRIRLWKILLSHRNAANVWNRIIEGYSQKVETQLFTSIKAKQQINNNRIVWQYWAQGYDDLPEIVSLCMGSVDRFCVDCRVIRLCDSTISDYIDLPDYVKRVPEKFGYAFFSDLLRCILLKLYGGVWLDATVLLTDSLPDDYFEKELFLFQRDPKEKHKDYWEDTYAYYFGWKKGFRVNMLSSILFAQRNTPFINYLCGLMLLFSQQQNSLPNYFMFQILFDVLSKGEMASHNCDIKSDCLPHYLMQICNDVFPYAKDREVLSLISIHKLSYKNIDINRLKQCLSSQRYQ